MKSLETPHEGGSVESGPLKIRPSSPASRREESAQSTAKRKLSFDCQPLSPVNYPPDPLPQAPLKTAPSDPVVEASPKKDPSSTIDPAASSILENRDAPSNKGNSSNNSTSSKTTRRQSNPKAKDKVRSKSILSFFQKV